MARGRAGVLLPLLALASVALSGVFVLDLWRAATLPSGCEMTYSWPVYTPLTWSKASQHYKYALFSVHMHERREELTGVPVLFLPGHLGSYKQARSIARHLFDADATLFDVFALDFRSEFTALSGDFVTQQAQYVNTAIRTILRQYKKQQLSALKKKSKSKRMAKPSVRTPDSVLIVAHSMGGVVARVAETLPSYTPNSIQHVVTLGSPHDRAVLPFDADMQSVYATISATTSAHDAGSNASLVDVISDNDDASDAPVYISITGGHKDTLLHASFSATDRLAHPQRTLAALTTAMPGVQLTIDHVCLLWCHQLLARVAQSLVAVVDSDTRALVPRASQRLAAARDVLLGTDAADVDVDAATVLRHKAHVRDGYATHELERYALWTPPALLHLLRSSYATLFVVIYALTLHILSLQIAHWQSAFELTSAADAAAAAAARKFPSFTAMLHPLAHAPLFVKRALAAVTCSGADVGGDMAARTSTRSTAVVAAVGALALVVETARRNASSVAPYAVVLELAVLYVYALGLLYAIATAFSGVRALVVSRVVTALAARTKTLPRWAIITAVHAFVLALGQIESVAPFRFVAALEPARNVALLVLASFAVFVLYLVALGANVSTSADQQRLQRSLFAFYALSLVPWIGKVLVFVDTVLYPPRVLSNALLLQSCVCIAVLSLARFVVSYSQEAMLPMPPTAFFGSATGQDAAALYDNDRSSTSSTSSSSGVKITAENCPDCVFEDGGPGAILIEYTNAQTQRLRCKRDVVLVGPSFRVVACDCVVRYERPRDFCDFCTRSCRRCGGGAGNFTQATRYKDFVVETQTATTLHALVPLLLEALALAQLTLGLRREHLAFYFTPVCSLALLVYHVALLTDVEAKRRKNKRNKASKKKKRKSKTKASGGSAPTAAPVPPVTVNVSASTSAPSAMKSSTNSASKASGTAKASKNKSKKQSARPPNPNVPESLFVNPIYEMVDDDE